MDRPRGCLGASSWGHPPPCHCGDSLAGARRGPVHPIAAAYWHSGSGLHHLGRHRHSGHADLAPLGPSPHVPTTDIIVTSRQPIAVLGATGNQGGHVARALLEAGWPVHAITRHPESPPAQQLATLGARIVQADMGDVDTLIRAFDGACGIFSVQNFWELGLREEVRLGANVIEAAKAIGTPHVVYSSGLGAEQIQGVAAIDGKAILEERLRRSELPFTILRPGLFMDDFHGASLPFAGPIQRVLHNHRPLVGRLFLATLRGVVPKNSPIPLTTLHDVGRMVVWVLEHPGIVQGQAYQVVGSTETTETLCTLWGQLMQQEIPRVPGIKITLHLVHPKMADLLSWLSQHQPAVNEGPLALQVYGDWLESFAP